MHGVKAQANAGEHSGGRFVVPLLAFLGVMAYALPMGVVTPALPVIQRATGVNTLIRTVGASLGTQASAVIVAASISPRTGLATERGFVASFAVCAGVMGAVVVIALIAPARRNRHGGAKDRSRDHAEDQVMRSLA